MVILIISWRLGSLRLGWEWECLGDLSCREICPFISFNSRKSTKFLLEDPGSKVKIQEGTTHDFGKTKRKSNHYEIYKNILPNKNLFSREKYIIRSLSHSRGGLFLTPSPTGLSTKWGRGMSETGELSTVKEVKVSGDRLTKRMKFNHKIIDCFTLPTPYHSANRTPVWITTKTAARCTLGRSS